MDEALEAADIRTEHPFSFLREKSSLQMLAASKYALLLWRNLYYDETRYGRPAWFSFHEVLPESRRETSKIPPLLEAFIDDRILKIGEEIKMWEINLRAAVLHTNVRIEFEEDLSKRYESLFTTCRFLPDGTVITQSAGKAVKLLGLKYLTERLVLDEKHVDILVKGFDNIACNPDGSVCFQTSARNLITKEDLDPLIKFRIACTFCLEDEVRDIWPSVNEIPDNDIFGWDYDKPSLMMYWKNILYHFEVEDPFLPRLLLNVANDRNWAAFEYLLDQVSEDTRITSCLAVVHKDGFYSMKRVLLKLNENQLQNVGIRIGDEIFCNFVTNEKCYEYAIDAWTCMKNYIPGNMFARIVFRLWRLVFNPSESELTKVKQTSSLLLELWSSASESQKRFVQKQGLFRILDNVVRDVHQYDLKFMSELLTDMPLEFRKLIWHENWRKLIIRTIPSELMQMMELFFANSDEIEHFNDGNVKRFVELTDYFSDFVSKGLYSELNDCLSFFIKGPRRLEELSEEIIMSNLDHIASHDENQLTDCHQFIRNTFRDAEKGDKFIKGMISSPECLGWIYCKLDECCFDKVANLCRKFPCSKVALEEMKQEFLVYCYRNLARGQIFGFNGQTFTEFVSWCSPGEDEVSELRDLLFIDDIFEIILKNFVLEASKNPRGPTQRLLYSFDNFLQWHFGCSEAAKHYKSIKLFNCNEWKGLKSVLAKADPQCVQEFLYWGFEKDQDQVEKVKLRLSQES
ncbi:uncharacterized protein LOC135844958 isoform X3 [Planococcus citri]|uniref:uncharacterized protein LOC135844958 isoform X3 n=1 Tax=Planococcus citri TaxID=170843 RepID=UPI0031F90434